LFYFFQEGEWLFTWLPKPEPSLLCILLSSAACAQEKTLDAPMGILFLARAFGNGTSN